ncbi:extracellular catalytic domain type 1 short-chain-length polyhydroxyalkanoate depolymerase [Azohydromonas australica]|uniref:extracellular catalytic domain type 1 short-chain-length polyhydroxyalkanoate depolymerase n=1 Tax=Azohydromonas australica TaxID=364039 RepID=UPI000404322C|nr:PHB depolymerase family esterase [Azohydromonas australica]
MNPAFQQAMAEATRLTRAGDLQAAAALIQAALAGQVPPPAPHASPTGGRWDVIDIQARVLDDHPPGALPGSAFEAAPRAAEASPPAAATPVPPDAPPRDTAGAPRPAADPARAKAGAFLRRSLSALAKQLTDRPDGGFPRPVTEPEPAGAPAEAPCRPGGDSFLDGHHTEAGLSRDYKLYVPPERHGKGLPLVVMLHGCTQHPDDFAVGTGMNAAAREQGFYVLYPAQAQKANPQRCWNWFKHNHQGRGRGEPALLAGMTRAVVERHGIDPQRVYVAGLSAGGAMAAILGAAYPDLFAAVGVHSGLPAGAARDLPSALAAMQGAPAGAGGMAGGTGLADLPELKRLMELKGLPGLKDLKQLKDLPGMPDLGELPGMAGLPGWDGLEDGEAEAHANEKPAAQGPVPPTIVFHGDRDGTVHPSNGERALAACTEAAAASHTERGSSPGGRSYTRRVWHDATGRLRAEHWAVHGAGHAWSGGRPGGSYTDASGPDATAAMLQFFEAQRLRRPD